MRTRLLTTMVGLVVLALVLVGAGTAVVASTRSASTTERHVVRQTRALAAVFEDVVPAVSRLRLSQGVREQLRHSMNLEEIGVAVVPRDGSPPVVLSELPRVVTYDDLRPLAEDAAGPDEAVHTSGVRDAVAWAAAVVPLRSTATGSAIVVVASRRSVNPLAGILAGTYQWMLLGTLVSIVVSVLLALRLSRSLAHPVIEVAAAAHQIADGRLDTRLDPDLTGSQSRRPDEVSKLVAAVNTMAEGLERSRGLERQFLLSVSHDLRTPMTSIRGYAEALVDGTISEPIQAGKVILAEAARLERLVRDLLELAHLDARQFALDLHPVDIATSTAEVVDAFSPMASKSGIQVTVETSATNAAGIADDVVAMVDHNRWAQIVGNLVENGLRYAATTLTVEIHSTGPSIQVRIIDDGPGIATNDLPHVFERLYVAQHRPTDRESGSGLGLAIVRELVEAMNGEVEAVAPPDGGTEMVVRIPSVSEE